MVYTESTPKQRAYFLAHEVGAVQPKIHEAKYKTEPRNVANPLTRKVGKHEIVDYIEFIHQAEEQELSPNAVDRDYGAKMELMNRCFGYTGLKGVLKLSKDKRARQIGRAFQTTFKRSLDILAQA